MDLKAKIFLPPIFILLFLLLISLACSTPSWFPIKKGPPHKAKMKELLDKEVIIIDKEEYVRVYNPRVSEGGDQPKYLYIPVKEYLAKRGSYTASTIQKEDPKKGSSVAPIKALPLSTEREVFTVSPFVSRLPDLKKKVVIAHFDDRTTQADEVFGDWMSEKLIKEINRRSNQIIFVDYQTVKEFLKNKEISLTDLEEPNVLNLLNEVFGIHALVAGYLSGPYVFATKREKDKEGTVSAIIKIDLKLVETLSGKTLKNLSVTNPIIAAKETGSFSEEKAKAKAIDFTLADLGRALSKELENLDWFCRIAKVEGEEVYINAGKLTGLKVGDVMDLYDPGETGERGEVKGKVKISGWFGTDASIGKMTNGKKPEINDILKLAKREGS